MSNASPVKRARKSGCTLCGAAIDPAYSPFCGRGCRDRDLLAWMGEGYRIPGRPIELDDEGEPVDPDGAAREPTGR